MESNHPSRLQQDVGSVLARHQSVDDAQYLATIDRTPGRDVKLSTSKIYHPLSLPVLALLMPASMFGVLARLGLQALMTYAGQSIFSLAYVQATGCFIMGLGLGMKEPFGNLYVPPMVWVDIAHPHIMQLRAFIHRHDYW
jgi:CrcB protein